MIRYTEKMTCSKEDLQELYLSVNWNSGKYPDRLFESIQNSTYKMCYFFISCDKITKCGKTHLSLI